MIRPMTTLLAAGLGLAVALAAHGQTAMLDWVDIPPGGDALTKRLEDEATRLAARRDDAQHLRTVSFDYFYPATPREYQALGGNGVLQLSAVARNPKDLPVKRAVLRFGGKDVVLQPIADRESTVPAGTPLAKAIGVNRQDAFFLLPGKLPRKTGDLWVFFSVPGNGLNAGSLSLVLPGALNPDAPAAQPDPVALRKVLAREYPNLVKP